MDEGEGSSVFSANAPVAKYFLSCSVPTPKTNIIKKISFFLVIDIESLKVGL
jgi:hypothetical protein